jgi:hypothetical protein
MNSTFLWKKPLYNSLYERIICVAEFFSQRPNFLVDLVENIRQELATLTMEPSEFDGKRGPK